MFEDPDFLSAVRGYGHPLMSERCQMECPQKPDFVRQPDGVLTQNQSLQDLSPAFLIFYLLHDHTEGVLKVPATGRTLSEWIGFF